MAKTVESNVESGEPEQLYRFQQGGGYVEIWAEDPENARKRLQEMNDFSAKQTTKQKKGTKNGSKNAQ